MKQRKRIGARGPGWPTATTSSLRWPSNMPNVPSSISCDPFKVLLLVLLQLSPLTSSFHIFSFLLWEKQLFTFWLWQWCFLHGNQCWRRAAGSKSRVGGGWFWFHESHGTKNHKEPQHGRHGPGNTSAFTVHFNVLHIFTLQVSAMWIQCGSNVDPCRSNVLPGLGCYR